LALLKLEDEMGAAFYTGGTVKIRKYLHTFFGKAKIKATANTSLALFDPANGVTISDALTAMDLPPRNDATYGAKLQARFKLLFDNMLASDVQWNTTTHNDLRKSIFDALVDANATPQASVKPIKFYVAHQNSGPPFSAQNPEFRFVNWTEDDDTGQTWYNFLLICPELPGPIASRLKRAVSKSRSVKKANTSKKKKKAKK
jgi:hypothetical protein